MVKFSRLFIVFLILFFVSALRLEAVAQVRPVYDRGIAGLVQSLENLGSHFSALMIGAHPDDEDTAMLAYLARRDNARTAYLSLTRGDGGQNIIGPELGEALGVIRTEELLQARTLDGAGQFFGRAYDYGFSKTLAEAKSKWDEKIILCDTVRVIRTFRPTVVLAQFSGTPADGHGQHQFAGYIAPLAVKAAADPAQCTDSGKPWSVSRVFTRQRGTNTPSLRINTGSYDSLLGRSYFEIAMEARSQHKSQEQGVLELQGDQFSSLIMADGRIPGTGLGVFESLPFESVDSREVFRRPVMQLDAAKIGETIDRLTEAYRSAVIWERTNAVPGRWYYQVKKDQIADALVRALGIQFDALSDVETAVPGETFLVSAKTFLPFIGNGRSSKVKDIRLVTPAGWKVEKAETPKTNSPAFSLREVARAAEAFNVTVDRAQLPTQPYWLVDPRDGDLFRWNSFPEAHTQPFQRSPIYAMATIEIDGIDFQIERPVAFRFADDIRGEIRRNVDVVPSMTLSVDQPMLIVAQSDRQQTRRIAVSVTNHSSKPITGIAGVNIPVSPEWRHVNTPATIDLKRKGEKASFNIDVTIPAKTKPGAYSVLPNVMVGESLATQSINLVAYPHIQTHRYYRRAAVDVRVIDLKTSAVKVGYIAGSGDRVPEAIRQMGFDLEMISESALASGNLSRFDVIVIGIRAYQVRPDLVANNKRLLDYANGGGTLIVQYQLPAYAQQNLAPYPMQMGPRVTDEDAEVKIVVPESPIFNFPNKIGPNDFEGWVQERNLYNFSTMDPKYAGLLESHDGTEAENKGGLVIADVGKGKYIYCSYSLFRQLPAGVPGAYRLLANMLSLPRAKK